MATKRKTCPRCRVGGYTQGTATDGRPEFTCTRCDYRWTHGKTGGEYAQEPTDECGMCDGSYCAVHFDRPCDCDTAERHGNEACPLLQEADDGE